MATETYQVTIDRPERVTRAMVRDYIKTAVSRWSGGGDPSEPINNISLISVTGPQRIAATTQTVELLVKRLQEARECIAYCRKNHPDSQKGEGIPFELLIDEALEHAGVRS